MTHTPVVLYRGELTAEGELPVAWSVDDQGDAERLIVVLSRRVSSDAELAERARAEVQESDETWVRKYITHHFNAGLRGAADKEPTRASASSRRSNTPRRSPSVTRRSSPAPRSTRAST